VNIARCTPSRGLVHSRTEQAAETVRLLAEADGHRWCNFWSHDLPIPDCFNDVCERAWNWGAEMFWLLEEDVAPANPIMTFAAMMMHLQDGADYATTTYPIGPSLDTGGASPLNFDGAGRLIWSATGCILLARRCFELMPRPWFALRNRLVKPGVVTWDGGEASPYGCDIGFTFALHQLGLKPAVVWDEVHHFRLREPGNHEHNDGYHRIEPLQWGKETEQWQFYQEKTDE